ncbi:hypothetical protein T492DRAFT_481101 [Pavlovales sp. CCMP2436]|nr:hypothetical protein T492DRAFT_481101 [Pavlovales sp. CCMP2436]
MAPRERKPAGRAPSAPARTSSSARAASPRLSSKAQAAASAPGRQLASPRQSRPPSGTYPGAYQRKVELARAPTVGLLNVPPTAAPSLVSSTEPSPRGRLPVSAARHRAPPAVPPAVSTATKPAKQPSTSPVDDFSQPAHPALAVRPRPVLLPSYGVLRTDTVEKSLDLLVDVPDTPSDAWLANARREKQRPPPVPGRRTLPADARRLLRRSYDGEAEPPPSLAAPRTVPVPVVRQPTPPLRSSKHDFSTCQDEDEPAADNPLY